MTRVLFFNQQNQKVGETMTAQSQIANTNSSVKKCVIGSEKKVIHTTQFLIC